MQCLLKLVSSEYVHQAPRLLRLEDSGVGCYPRGDFALLAPSASALRWMHRVCSDFASETGLSFNAEKTQLICFCRCTSVPIDIIEFCNRELSFPETVIHLGHILCGDLSDRADILDKTRDFIHCSNCLLTNFAPCSPNVKTSLLQFYCFSLLGAPLWKLSSSKLHYHVVYTVY